MAAISTDTNDRLRGGTSYIEEATSTSAVSWGAVIAGAAAAAALSLILLILGTGLGLSSVSPWSRAGVSATTFGISTILWITFTQLVASALGGYLAGRLRTKWTDVARDEVYFRDTAHGFLAWAVASLATAALLTSAIGSIVDTGVQAGAQVAGTAAGVAGGVAGAAGSAATAVATRGMQEGGQGGGAAANTGGGGMGLGYYVDSLFRRAGAPSNSDQAGAPEQSGAATPDQGQAQSIPTGEVTRIFANALRTGSLPQEDANYLGQLIAQRTGMDPQQAQQRVTDTFSRMQNAMRDAETAAKEAADKARKASAATALWMFIALLIGAFVASLSATYGGRQRDL